jgi:hypothetical protein
MTESDCFLMMLCLTEYQNYIIYRLTLVKSTRATATEVAVAVAAEAAEAVVADVEINVPY